MDLCYSNQRRVDFEVTRLIFLLAANKMFFFVFVFVNFVGYKMFCFFGGCKFAGMSKFVGGVVFS